MPELRPPSPSRPPSDFGWQGLHPEDYSNPGMHPRCMNPRALEHCHHAFLSKRIAWGRTLEDPVVPTVVLVGTVATYADASARLPTLQSVKACHLVNPGMFPSSCHGQ